MRKELSFAAVLLLCSPCLAGAKGRGERPREGDLEVGEAAPDFELKRLEGEGSVKLSSFLGKAPVVLIFGSYT